MKKKILIISGGISKERKISLETGKEVAKELKKNGYTVKECEPNDDLIRIAKTFKPKIIFNALHGQFGEDGYIQSILENLKIPYTHSGVIASAKAMNKEISKKIFNKNKILTPKYIKYTFKNRSSTYNGHQKRSAFGLQEAPGVKIRRNSAGDGVRHRNALTIFIVTLFLNDFYMIFN